jgi:nitrate/nitrite transporter NarK
VKDRFQWSSSSAGATFLLIAVPSLLSPIAGSLSDRFDPKWIAVAGFGVSVAALFGIGLVTKPTFWELAAMFGLLFLIGDY